MLCFFLVTGKAADSFDRKKVVYTAETVLAVAVLIFVILNHLNHMSKFYMLFLLFVVGTAYAFQGPSSNSLLPNVVSKDEFPKATALLTSMFQLATIIGPMLGGFFIHFGYTITYSIICVFAIVSVTCIHLLKTVSAPGAAKGESSLKSVLSGINFIRSKRAIFGAISMDMIVVLFGGATALLPVYASSILHVGSVGYGVLRSAQAFGALVVSFYLARHTIKKNVGMKMFCCVIAFGLMTIGFSLSRNLILSLVFLALLGAFDVVSMVVRSSFVQLNTPDDLRGRVSSVNLLFTGTSNQLGEFESGTLATFIGAVPAVFVGGVIAVVVTVTWMGLFPELRKAQDVTEKFK
jgi:MFS family permease